MMSDVLRFFEGVKVKKTGDSFSIHKPLLLLLAVARCFYGKERLATFLCYEDELSVFRAKFGYFPVHYPFGRLVNDGLWEVENYDTLGKSSSGDVSKTELIEKNIKGGLTNEVYEALIKNKDVISDILGSLLRYFPPEQHHGLCAAVRLSEFLLNDSQGNLRMALIGNEGEPVSRWWVSKAISIIKVNKEIFSTGNMRDARRKLIAGKNRLKTIKAWMIAAEIIKNGKTSKESELTNFGLAIHDNDPGLEKSSTWWAFHLATCLSNTSEPYPSFFLNLDTHDWVRETALIKTIKNTIKKDNNESYEDSTLESFVSSVRRMFAQDRPLAELGLIETRNNREQDNQERGISIRLGSPKLTDEIIIHALAMMRFKHYKSTPSARFSDLTKNGLANFLCCTPAELREHLRRMKQSGKWQDYFTFNEQLDLDSVSFADSCLPDKTVLLLLQESPDTWL